MSCFKRKTVAYERLLITRRSVRITVNVSTYSTRIPITVVLLSSYHVRSTKPALVRLKSNTKRRLKLL